MDIDLEQIRAAIERDAAWVVFTNVLMQQLGLPLPVLPTLLLAGSLASGAGHGASLLMVAVAASVIADLLWYLAGKTFGYRVLAGLCRISINPETCVTQTEGRFIRWGIWSLLVAKFIPGFSTVGPPIAGALRMPLTHFIFAAGLGAAFWAGSALLAGWLLRDELHRALAQASQHGSTLLVSLLALLGLWLCWKLWRRRRFQQLAAIPHIGIDELVQALASERPPLLIDLRGSVPVGESGPIPGARRASLDDLLATVDDWPRDAPIVTLCACPADATAVRAAHLLTAHGYLTARPLKGGHEAWQRANPVRPPELA